ncbi:MULTISPECIES: helix-turn-helix transcriptional regulator [unclassified Streptomyces]|uniref:helix-turn-helix domain-containing protein n=1 Tax=unclassified Streptomyces TaxID=2593676 RepID=UPI0023673527|nr:MULTISPECIES: helix-turn-helix transcriptional regulator [unclassified Streptomyces]MDF3145246.1 helix-turn-helix transcriptional regulator [Streptomyces sp. T21Q-yed]WDF35736.1 helix-turn-helix transcriptional regulator [Streptomyces sp. T12]
MSLAELAGQARLAKQALSNLVQGAGSPMVDTLFSIAVVLGVPATRLVAELSAAIPVCARPPPSGSQRCVDRRSWSVGEVVLDFPMNAWRSVPGRASGGLLFWAASAPPGAAPATWFRKRCRVSRRGRGAR